MTTFTQAEFLEVDKTARICAVSNATVCSWVREGALMVLPGGVEVLLREPRHASPLT